ncbi:MULTISPECIES: hypothetical protein [unclassified Streptomyces]|uniref:hypothetical protein n=1 Tax=unclassified Streptomyces TaxID=2593676 RepID=UPI000DDAE84D|nr:MULTISPECIES: hypothetical protein [unclassified Streptomyces]QZZ26562.1 hypothetical protein A7X85_10100 [Streptomyces sp. ST1015]
MTSPSPLTDQQLAETAADRPSAGIGSVRPVIEHALTAYGYSLDIARTLIDRLIAEARAE